MQWAQMSASAPYDPVAAGERALADAPLTLRAARAGGPGGQHVNTTDSAVTISVAVADLDLDEVRLAQLSERLARMIGEALRPRTPRRPTRPGKGAVERRLDEKRQTSARKRTRRPPGDDA